MRTIVRANVVASVQSGLLVCLVLGASFLVAPVESQEAVGGFTIVVLPDTQYYSSSYPQIFDSQTEWIVDNAGALNTVFVSHEGDVIDSNEAYQWENANHSLSLLDGYVPWGLGPGNHDLFDVKAFDSYFGVDRFSGESWYGGGFMDSNANNYELFSGGGDDYLIFHFQYNPSDAVLVWANQTIAVHPDRRVIVTTHDYLSLSGSRSTVGERIWSEFVQPHADQVFLVLCGHYHSPTVAEVRRTDMVGEHVVYQLLADYQERANGGDGFLRILNFSPGEDKIYVSTYSPYIDSYETDSDSEFELAFNMTTFPTVSISPTSAALVFGQSQFFSAVVSGGTPPLSYQWYLNDSAVAGATSATWTFTARSNGNYTVYANVTDNLFNEAKSNVVSLCVYSVYLELNLEPNQAVCSKGQKLAFSVTVFNQLNPALDLSLFLSVSCPGGYYHFDVQPITVSAGSVFEYRFVWDVPDVAGTYVAEAALVPLQLTAYDAFWLEAA